MILVLLFIGIILVILNVKAISKEKKDFNSVFKDKFDNMDDFSIEIGRLRNEFGETVFELQQEIVDLKKELSDYKYKNNKILSNDQVEIESIKEKNNQISLNYEEFEAEVEEDHEFEEDFDNNKTNENLSDQVYNEITFNNKVKPNNEEIKNLDNEERKSSVKYEEIDKLLKEGFSVDEISEKLNMGKGEVLLIKELYLK